VSRVEEGYPANVQCVSRRSSSDFEWSLPNSRDNQSEGLPQRLRKQNVFTVAKLAHGTKQ
jgi:hypothetical protein